jgi:N-acyl-D-aspartate/D-glutamate deacylase
MPGGYDLVVRDGLIVDGTDGEPYRGDVAVKESLIVAVGTVAQGGAHEQIDSAECLVTPGFVDITIVSGEPILQDDKMTGSLPGRLGWGARGPRH